MGSNPSQPVCDFSNNYSNKTKVSIDTLERLLRLKSLTDKTIKTYLSCYNTFTRFAGKREVTKRLLEDYLLGSRNRRNNLAMLKVLYPDLVRDIGFPRATVKPKILPSKVHLKTFYYALPDKYKVVFLMLASSGLRVGELLKAEIDKANRMIIPNHNSQTKNSWVSFYNEETAALLENGFPEITVDGLNHVFKKVSKKTGIRIYPHLLRAIELQINFELFPCAEQDLLCS
ncbi:Uncharacterised protein [uncultured archaeon]|nr:Uncharacterised protein [uncultured archaeon]